MDQLGDIDGLLSGNGPADALRLLVAHHVDFALSEHVLISDYLHDDRTLPVADRRRLRQRQHEDVERWVGYVLEVNDEMDAAEALCLVHGGLHFIPSVALHKPKLEVPRLRELLEPGAICLLMGEKGLTTRWTSDGAPDAPVKPVGESKPVLDC